MKEEASIKVVGKNGAITGKPLYRVKGDPNSWCATPQEAIEQFHKCNAYWAKYHSTTKEKK